MARPLNPWLVLGALLGPVVAQAEEAEGRTPARIEASVAAGRMQLFGLGDYADLGHAARLELAVHPTPWLRAGLSLQGGLHDVVHWEIQEGDRGVWVPGDLDLWQAGGLVRWLPLEGTWQPGLRAEAGIAHWRTPVVEDSWREVSGWSGLIAPTHGTGPWVALGAELGVEVSDGGPTLGLVLDGGWLQAGPLSGPIAGGRVVFGTAL